MNQETLIRNSELEALASDLGETFIQRWDLYARQLNDGSYICIREPLETTHLLAHLKGKITLGAYVLDQASQARFIVFDADQDDQLDGLVDMAHWLDEQGAPSYLESSRRGGHLWLFFSQPVPGKDARRFGHALLERFNLAGLELFPKQDKLAGGPGSLVRLPFGVHRKTGKRYGFLTLDRQPLSASLAEQAAKLCTPETVPGSFFNALVGNAPPAPAKNGSAGLEAPTEPLSKRIKDRISVLDFVSQYVELAPNGRGLCPFHEDHHQSFSVDAERNYWYCFAGCGGGSIIDFWMKWNNYEFKEAVRELAKKLL